MVGRKERKGRKGLNHEIHDPPQRSFEETHVIAGCGVMGVGANGKMVCRNAAELPQWKMTSDYRELDVWQLSMGLCESVYGLLRQFPAEEKYALCDQLRRAVVSIPSNIAEGNGRGSATEYARFVAIARGSLFEVRTQLELAVRLGYISVSDEMWLQIDRISKMLYSLMSKLRH